MNLKCFEWNYFIYELLGKFGIRTMQNAQNLLRKLSITSKKVEGV